MKYLHKYNEVFKRQTIPDDMVNVIEESSFDLKDKGYEIYISKSSLMEVGKKLNRYSYPFISIYITNGEYNFEILKYNDDIIEFIYYLEPHLEYYGYTIKPIALKGKETTGDWEDNMDIIESDDFETYMFTLLLIKNK